MNSYLEPIKGQVSPGKNGQSIKLSSNYFKVDIPQNLTVYLYNVSIFTKESSKLVGKRSRDGNKKLGNDDPLEDYKDTTNENHILFNRNIMNSIQEKYDHEIGTLIAYDGRQIAVTPQEINRQCLQKKYHLKVDPTGVMLENKTSNFICLKDIILQIQYTNMIDFNRYKESKSDANQAFQYLHLLDIIVLQVPWRKGYIQVQNCFYDPSEADTRRNITETSECWRGFFYTMRQCKAGLALNIDLCFSSMWVDGGKPLYNLCKRVVGGYIDWDMDGTKSMITQELKGVLVQTLHTGNIHKIYGFSEYSASQTKFIPSDETKSISVYQYFQDTYDFTLNRPNDPCVKVHPRKDIFIPLELLEVMPNQKLPKDQDVTSCSVALSDGSCKYPYIRVAKIAEVMKHLDHSTDGMMRAFGICVNKTPMQISARVLPTPSVCYSNSFGKLSPMVPSKGVWKPDASHRFIQPSHIARWCVINASSATNEEAARFLNTLRTAAVEKRVSLAPPFLKKCPSIRDDDVEKYMKELFDPKPPLQLALIMIELPNRALHKKIKMIGDLKAGILTQIVTKKTVKNPTVSAMTNILLKINAKAGGVNQIVRTRVKPMPMSMLKIQDDHTMILGADVSHPGQNTRNPSVAALVGSLDRNYFRFAGVLQKQGKGVEIMNSIGDMFMKLYEYWAQGNKKQLRSIIMFRDGVADSQYRAVVDMEIAALRNTCKSLTNGKGSFIKITYVIVTKRHHTRLFPIKNSRKSSVENLIPGAIVDDSIVSDIYHDFYLNSHEGLIGTNKPSKYTVLVDENSISPDELQEIIFRQSHLSARCNRSTSMVTSASHAHLLAYLGRSYFHGEHENGGVEENGRQSHNIPMIHTENMFWI